MLTNLNSIRSCRIYKRYIDIDVSSNASNIIKIIVKSKPIDRDNKNNN